MTNVTARPEPAPLDTVQRARDLLTEALAAMVMPSAEQLEALDSLALECRARAGATEPDALDRLVFRWRQLQTQREALVALVRRGRATEAPTC